MTQNIGVILLVASQWPVLLASFFILLYTILRNKNFFSARNLEKIFEDFRFGGHRGSPTVKPENTIASMKQAKSEGVDLIEFDISLTKDGVAVILHDDTLDRTTNMSGPIRSFFHRDLIHCNPAANFMHSHSESALEKMALPTMDEMVDWAKAEGLKMIFDVKDSDGILCEQLHKLFAQHDLYNSGIVCSFHPTIVYRLKKRYPEIPTGITWRRWQYSTKDSETLAARFSSPFLHYLAVFADIINAWAIRSTILPRFLGADLVLTHRAEISEGYVKHQNKRGLKVCAWTVNDPHEMNWMHKTLQIPFLTDKPFLAHRIIGECKSMDDELKSLNSKDDKCG